MKIFKTSVVSTSFYFYLFIFLSLSIPILNMDTREDNVKRKLNKRGHSRENKFTLNHFDSSSISCRGLKWLIRSRMSTRFLFFLFSRHKTTTLTSRIDLRAIGRVILNQLELGQLDVLVDDEWHVRIPLEDHFIRRVRHCWPSCFVLVKSHIQPAKLNDNSCGYRFRNVTRV